MVTPFSPSAASFLALTPEFRKAVYEEAIPASLLRISSKGFLVNTKPEESIYSVTSREILDVEYYASIQHLLTLADWWSIGGRVQFPDRLACVMGIGCEDREQRGWLSLLQTCRLVNSEFLPVLYSKTKFAFHAFRSFRHFFATVPREPNQKHIKIISLA